MAPPRDSYLKLPLGEWYEALADSTGVPGGGSALASALAGAASVLAMCARASGSGGHAPQAGTGAPDVRSRVRQRRPRRAGRIAPRAYRADGPGRRGDV